MAQPPPPLLSLSVATLARIHTALSLSAFFSALVLGCTLHYRAIVKNGVAGYPQEWFPSVSATIGDWYPERNVFQLLIALTAGPRFALLFLSYAQAEAQARAGLRLYAPSIGRARVLLVTGIVRALACGGWVFITSSDDHDVHDVLMIFYIVCNIPWMALGARTAGRNAARYRTAFASAFWLCLVPMVYFFVQHKVHRVPGAYTRYAFFEWALIFLDIAFDATMAIQFADSGLHLTLDFTESAGARHETSASTISASASAPPAQEQKQKQEIIPVIRAEIVEALPSANDKLWNTRELWTAVEFLSDVFSAYQAWTLITVLPVTLFYFSVWKLALAGSELATLATLSPFVLGVPVVRTWARTRRGRALCAAVGLAALGTYPRDSVYERLLATVGGVAAVCVRLGSEWDGAGTGYGALVFVLGLMFSSLSKHLNDGNNPLWSAVDEHSGSMQPVLLALGALATVEQLSRPTRSPYAPEHARVHVASPSTVSNEAVENENSASKEEATPREPWVRPALALGALIYGLHERLSDPAALVAWSWTGFKAPSNTGPHPHVHAPLTLVAQSAGIAAVLAFAPYYASKEVARGKGDDGSGNSGVVHLTMTRAPANVLAHPLMFALGAFSSALLVYTNDWPSYAGGLLHAFFLTAIAPHVLQQAGVAAGARGAGRVFGVAWAVWIVFLFVGTFTVAYAFVPGAWAFRERTDLVLAAQLALLASTFTWRKAALPHVSPLPAPARSHTRTLLSFLVLAAFTPPLLHRTPSPRPPHTHARSRLFRAGIWTVHFGIDFTGRDSQRAMRDLVRGLELDVVGLLETDLFRPVFGNRDLSRVMARELGYYVDIGPGPDKHTWGAVLLSKFPILGSKHHLLPSPDGELAPAIEAVLDIYGVNLTTVVAHNGQEETPLDRELQATALARIMSTSPYPVLFLGYVVTKPHASRPAPYEIMTSDGRMHDIDSLDYDRWCEYIFYRGLYRTAYARVSRGKVTDTELQVGQFVVPRQGGNESIPNALDTEELRYLRAWKEDMPEDHWFPQEYYGNEHEGGVDGHYYHVFNTPLYYKLPPGVDV